MKTYLIDASLLKESDCQLKTHLIHDRGLTNNHQTFKMQYGTAGHKCLAKYYAGEPEQECLKVALQHYLRYCHEPPPGDFRTIEHLAETLKTYFKVYPRNGDALKVAYSPVDPSKPLVEIPFAWPYYKNNNVEVIICGTIDFIGTYCGEKIFMDHKFTSMWRNPQNYFEGYELDTQMAFYIWALRKMGLVDFNMPCIINGIFIRGGTKNKPPGADFLRSGFITYTDEQLVDFANWLDLRVHRIIERYEYLPNYNRCKTLYGHCEFFQLCRLKKEHREDYIKGNFDVRTYNPLLFQA